MTRNLKVSLLIGSTLVVLWTTSSEACHRRRARATTTYGCAGDAYAAPAGYYASGQGGTAGYTDGYGQPSYAQPGYAQPGYGQPYDFGRPGYNPGGLGGPRSGLGVRPGLGVGGFGPGR